MVECCHEKASTLSLCGLCRRTDGRGRDAGEIRHAALLVRRRHHRERTDQLRQLEQLGAADILRLEHDGLRAQHARQHVRERPVGARVRRSGRSDGHERVHDDEGREVASGRHARLPAVRRVQGGGVAHGHGQVRRVPHERPAQGAFHGKGCGACHVRDDGRRGNLLRLPGEAIRAPQQRCRVVRRLFAASPAAARAEGGRFDH